MMRPLRLSTAPWLAFGFALCGCVTTMLAMTPLEAAAYNGDAATVDAMLAQGAEPGHKAFSYALQQHPAISRTIVRKCLEIYAPGRDCAGLRDAAVLGDAELARAFLAKGADLEQAVAEQQTAVAQLQQLRQQMSGMVGGSMANGPDFQFSVSENARALELLRGLRAERAAPAAQAPAPANGAKAWWTKDGSSDSTK
jgi:hypothetical protein